MPQPQLSAEDQRELRDAASDAFTQTGDRLFPKLRARMLFEKDPRVQRIAKLDPATIFLLLQIAIKLWQWWRDRKVSDPSVVASAGEPTFGVTE
jgi:hypothetical protein